MSLLDAVVITGQRPFVDRELIYAVLDYLAPQTVIEGTAPGADTIAGDWARRVNRHAAGLGLPPVVRLVEMPAPWKEMRERGENWKLAGPIRNRWMLKAGQDLADAGDTVALLAFIDETRYGESRGTRNCIEQCLGRNRYEKDVFDLPVIDAKALYARLVWGDVGSYVTDDDEALEFSLAALNGIVVEEAVPLDEIANENTVSPADGDFEIDL